MWTPDILGHGFEMCHIPQGKDYSGRVRSTIIRKRAGEDVSRGVLYVHGFSDYFFQEEMADLFVERDYNFYAVDLRKYGRSYICGQKMFQVKDLREYFPDIQAGIDQMKEEGNDEVVLVGHSTGGLISSFYMQREPDDAVKGLILNSPFLAWNLPVLKVKVGVPLLKALAWLFPNFPVKSDGSNTYAMTLAKHLGGEWTYNTAWKPDVLPDVDASWVRAIDNAQKALRHGGITVPVLLLHSTKSAKPGASLAVFKKADGVLNVKSISAAGRLLGPQVKEVAIKDGLHDLVLSRKDVREKVYESMFRWLEEQEL